MSTDGHTLLAPPPTAALAEVPIADGHLCARLCVLSSSSRGNCTALVVDHMGQRRLYLIDAGLSPRRTHAHLLELGLGDLSVHGIILTHLDHDHWHPGWLAALPEACRLHLHHRHKGRAGREGLLYQPTELFTDGFDVSGIQVRCVLNAHDQLGSAALRFAFPCGRSLGFATDLGRPSQRLIDLLRGVEILAIESNYCPKLQAASPRPSFLKDRITNGAGHLSNEQAAEAIAAIAPREKVVLLHLSLDCNRPELARAHHHGSSYELILAKPDAPTPWIRLASPELPRPAAASPTPLAKPQPMGRGRPTQGLLFN